MKNKTIVTLIISLAVSSVLLFALHFFLFHDLHHIAIYTVHDLAFLPVEVLIVSLFLHGIIESDQKKQMMEKMNIAIGMFFSDGGTELLKMITGLDKGSEGISRHLQINPNWKRDNFRDAAQAIEQYEGNLQASMPSLKELETFLSAKRDTVMRLLENPNLMEHEYFTDLLWAVFHLAEELIARHGLSELPENDLKHVAIDIMRVYRLLLREWLKYMKHLQKQYPYLFSMAVRTNPLNKNAEVIFK